VRTVVGGTKPHLELMTRNPLGKIPTLELEDGGIVYDSFVVIAYLDTLHAGPKLIPAGGAPWLTALRRHALGNGMLDVALAALGERFRPAAQQSEPHLALWHLKLHTCVEARSWQPGARPLTRGLRWWPIRRWMTGRRCSRYTRRWPFAVSPRSRARARPSPRIARSPSPRFRSRSDR
jgi:hypothetical protein